MSLRTLKRKNGLKVYHLDLRVPDLDTGRKRRVIRSLGTTDRTEAEVRYHKLAAELLPGVRAPRGVTLSMLQKRVVAFSVDKSDSTKRGVRYAFRSLIASAGDIQLERLTREGIDLWRQTLKTPRTANVYLAHLRAAYDLAILWKLTEGNPFAGVRRLTVRRDEKTPYFTEEQTDRLFEFVDNHRLADYYGPALRLLLYTGVRLGELCRLRPEHVGDYLRVEMTTKSRQHRLVPLRGIARVAAQIRLEAGHEWLFPSPSDPTKPVSTRTIWSFFSVACRAVGIAGHPHMMRHTFAARLLTKGRRLITVSRWMGHSSVHITDQVYGHLAPGAEDHLIEF